jgi:hypothetical protein
MSSNNIHRMTTEEYRQLVDRQIEAQSYINNLKKIENSDDRKKSILERQRQAMLMTMQENAALSVVRDA